MAGDRLFPVRRVLVAIDNIKAEPEGLDAESFATDRRARQLVERNLEIISEASRRIPDALKAKHPGVRWKDIAGIGNVLRHHYHRVEPGLLWQTRSRSLPPLKQAVAAIGHDLGRKSGPHDRAQSRHPAPHLDARPGTE
jgi:uncharacterized protein with HEPN domain